MKSEQFVLKKNHSHRPAVAFGERRLAERGGLLSLAIVVLMTWFFIPQGWSGAAYGQSSPAETAQFDTTLANTLQNALDGGVSALGLMGASVSVIVPGQGEWSGVSGFSDPVAGDTIRPDMIFAAGSITKTFVAALVLKLAEEGLLTLEDSLGQWLPSFSNIEGGITIRQLLNHTSGLYSFTSHPGFTDSIMADFTRVWAPEEVLATFVDAPVFPPGAFQEYSDTNYLLAGMIIKAATASEVSLELRNRFLDPLNLTSTFFEVEEQIVGEVAHGWEDFGAGLQDISSVPRTSLYSAAWTIGAIFSNAGDIARWGKALFEGNVLSASSLSEMLDFVPIEDYGLGVYRITLQGREVWGHDGGSIGFTSLMLYEPQDGICISVLLNIGELSLPVPLSNFFILDGLLGVVLQHIATGVDPAVPVVPAAFELHQNYPNPFNPTTNISYRLVHSGHVELAVYNTLGQKVRTLVDGSQSAGVQSVTWDGKDNLGRAAGSGIYFYTLKSGGLMQTRKMILVK